MVKYLILGGGPAGLTVANMMKRAGEEDFLVLEQEECAGGLCRSVEIDGSPFDIGGGHFLDVRRPNVNNFLFSFMPENEWNRFKRDSRIDINGTLINHPIEANIWQMNDNDQVSYLKSIAVAGCNIGKEKPDKFIDWIYWKLGTKIAEDYMIPYNKKMFGEELNDLGTYWLEKLPNVSFDETLLSCLRKKAYGKQPGHAEFYYPKKYGYGELWLRMAGEIEKKILYNMNVDCIDFEECSVKTIDGNVFKAEVIITTVPWSTFKIIKGMPQTIKESLQELKSSSIQTEYFNDNLDTTCHWIYYPDLNVPYHRILVRHNFCQGSKGYWTETNCDRVHSDNNEFKYINKYAYPLNTINKPIIMKTLLGWAKTKNVIGLGRWGEHQHYNSDVTVELAMKLVDDLLNR